MYFFFFAPFVVFSSSFVPLMFFLSSFTLLMFFFPSFLPFVLFPFLYFSLHRQLLFLHLCFPSQFSLNYYNQVFFYFTYSLHYSPLPFRSASSVVPTSSRSFYYLLLSNYYFLFSFPYSSMQLFLLVYLISF